MAQVTEGEQRFGYCDEHLESKLIAAGTWVAGQYGGDDADCNPFQFWRCSQPDCTRCYDHEMFGYFNFDRKPGSRIQANPNWQEHCGQHAETPFMFIGRFGKRRQFRCPMHGCDNIGKVVAECVEDVETPNGAATGSTGLSGAAQKEAKELAIFSDFAKAADLSLDWSENAKPPCPDIRCSIQGSEHWFELGRITDTKLAKIIKVKWPDDPKPFSFSQEEPFVRIILQKTGKRYETKGHPLDLVLHFDHQPPDRQALERYIVKHSAALNELRQSGPFSRIWIYDGWSRAVLWQSSE